MSHQVLSADQLADVITENKVKEERRAYEQLRAACYREVSKMAVEGEADCLVDLEESMIVGLESVTDELRSFGYKFRFIEREDSKGNHQCYKLLISVAHKMKEQTY